MGLGHFGGGVAAARWLARQGATVTVTDLAGEEALGESLRALAAEPIAAYRLGGHDGDDFRNAQLVVVNPAVKPGNRFLEIARRAGAKIVPEIELFLRHFRGKVVGVTGSNGKSTTAAMTAAVLQADGRRTWLGGNLGGSLLDRLDEMTADDWAVLEISSFQLWHASPAVRMPDVAIVTNCTPNHLDWHGTFAEYAAAKQRILGGAGFQPAHVGGAGFQPARALPPGQRAPACEQAMHRQVGNLPHGLVVLNTLDPEVATWSELAKGRLLPLIAEAELPELPVPGAHNRANARCAATAALAVGCSPDAVRQGLSAYRPLPGRLELVAVVDGRRVYNDTTATTPESTMAALESLEGPAWLLAGGGGKGSDFGPMAECIARRARGAAFYGAVRERLLGEMRSRGGHLPCITVETLAEALAWCWERSRRGESIVLSPGCSSHDQYQNFRQRGAEFVELVRRLSADSLDAAIKRAER